MDDQEGAAGALLLRCPVARFGSGIPSRIALAPVDEPPPAGTATRGIGLHQTVGVPSPIALDLVWPRLVVEAVGQLAGWIAMRRTDFTRRPVAALVGEISLSGVEARGNIELEAHIQRLDGRAILYCGTARCAGGEIAKLSRCVGPLMVLDEFDDPAVSAGAAGVELRIDIPIFGRFGQFII